MLPKRLVAMLFFSLAVALVAAAGLAGTAASAAAGGVQFGFGFGDRPHGPPPGWGHAPPPPGWGRPRPPVGWGPPPHFGRPGGWGGCRSRWVNQPVVDPWGRVIRYREVEIMDCGRPSFGPRW